MKIVLLALILFATHVSAAPLTCDDVFSSRHDFLQRLWEVTEFEGSEPIVEIDSYPERTPGRPVNRHSSQWWWTSPSLKHHLFDERYSRAEWSMSKIKSEAFYRKVYGQFQNVIGDGVIKALHDVDHTIEMDRSTYAEVRTATEVIGTWRWFRARLPQYSFPNDTIAELPYVHVNRVRGFSKGLEVTKKLNEFMVKGFSVVEIGKLSLDGSPELRKRAMETIELGWLMRAHEEDVYIAHVTSLAHIRLYKKYGFEVAERFEIDGRPEAILWVRGYDFRRHLEDLHHIEPKDSREPNHWPIRALLPNEQDHHQRVGQ